MNICMIKLTQKKKKKVLWPLRVLLKLKKTF